MKESNSTSNNSSHHHHHHHHSNVTSNRARAQTIQHHTNPRPSINQNSRHSPDLHPPVGHRSTTGTISGGLSVSASASGTGTGTGIGIGAGTGTGSGPTHSSHSSRIRQPSPIESVIHRPTPVPPHHHHHHHHHHHISHSHTSHNHSNRPIQPLPTSANSYHPRHRYSHPHSQDQSPTSSRLSSHPDSHEPNHRHHIHHRSSLPNSSSSHRPTSSDHPSRDSYRLSSSVPYSSHQIPLPYSSRPSSPSSRSNPSPNAPPPPPPPPPPISTHQPTSASLMPESRPSKPVKSSSLSSTSRPSTSATPSSVDHVAPPTVLTNRGTSPTASVPQSQAGSGSSLASTSLIGHAAPASNPLSPISLSENLGGTASYRTLNVRDALSYLDQVKMRFHEQNEVYNQFLDVMKLFKTQSIDTPGVIERVSTLFRGFPSLIQGFNTFLPAGFRIECTLAKKHSNGETADVVAVFTPDPVTDNTSLFPRDGAPPVVLGKQPGAPLPSEWCVIKSAPEGPRPAPVEPYHNSSGSVSKDLSVAPQPQPPQPPLPPSHPSRHKITSSSTATLTTHHPIRAQSPSTVVLPPDLTASSTKTENSVPMHDGAQSKREAGDSPRPTATSSQVNHRHEHSLSKVSNNNPSGPSTHPPAAHAHVTLNPRAPSPAYRYRPSSATIPCSTHHPTSSVVPSVQESAVSNSSMTTPQLLLAPELAVEPVRVTQPASITRTSTPVTTNVNGTTVPQVNVNNKPVEFNYAINYVNKIKHRFLDQPEIYKTFLEILQIYQRDGMPIDSVYVKVTKLFSNATDLLDEFKQFLPDLNNDNGASAPAAKSPLAHPPQSVGQVQKSSDEKSTHPSQRLSPPSATTILIEDRLAKHLSPAQTRSVDGPSDLRRHSPSPRSRAPSGAGPVAELAGTKNLEQFSQPQAKTPNPIHSHLLGNPSLLARPNAAEPATFGNHVPATPSRSLGVHSKVSASASTIPSNQSPPNKRSLAPISATKVDAELDSSGPLPPKKKRIGLGIKAPAPEPSHAHQLDTVASKPAPGTKVKRVRTKYNQPPKAIPSVPPESASVHHLMQHRDVDVSIGERTVQMQLDEPVYHTEMANWHTNRLETHDAMGGRTLTNTRELTLFESIKRYLNDKELWHDFLRVLELYNQSIIDFKTLLDRVSVYIGDEDALLEDFKGFVGYDVKRDGLVEDEVWEIKNVDVREREKVDATTIDREYGPSYKRLPRDEIDLACSGRDELCWAVLNDEYFGAAKFGTESGGPGHRKTNFEEVVAMTEGERAHFSYWLESLSRTIGHLESIQTRIESMDERERVNFHLGENLGGMSPSIYHRTLRKVYEQKYGNQIFPFLRDYPANSVPVVLRRLKELELNWKSAESQWNVVWREVERKNYYKAQDHQVLGFKSTEKTLIKGASLIKEIQELKEKKATLVVDVILKSESVKEDFTPKPIEADKKKVNDHRAKRQKSTTDIKRSHVLFSTIPEPLVTKVPPIRPSHQLELGFQDTDIFFDVLRIVAMALDRSALSHPERRRIDDTIRTLIPAVWNVTQAELEKQIPMIYDDEVSSEPSEDGMPTTTADRDLLSKKAVESLTRGLMKLDEEHERGGLRVNTGELETPLMSSPPNSVHNHHHRTIGDGHRYGATEEGSETRSFSAVQKWAVVKLKGQDGPQEKVLGSRNRRRFYNVFGTSTYVVLFRLLHTLYSRLLKLKTIAAELGPGWRRINPGAVELGLSHPIIGLDDDPEPSAQLYPYCLDQLSRYFDGELDFASFEESIRVAFPRDGYLLATVDKLSNAILKQFSQIHSESRNKELLALLRREREESSELAIAQISYRHLASSIIEDSELFRAEWVSLNSTLPLYLVSMTD
ncbi:hypothetical protein CROQUDRAFT_654425 [Cronartium quercuum f. sp. fusiforme G11]|uniref:Histone deacetylase interacting domain-containing protein n=1 Tax=Cronartium quercuum f. sp. fusiforme G11 TaxID=708437 RepID=A0A9P6NMN8_9BASI|nr:hypothetical protein CROQUDRAFT_654425 [Cronartium quercuum f. sp. fusiforme G11]